MITRITGLLLEKTPPTVVVDVHGIAYEILVPMSTLYQLPALGEQVVLHTHFLVREDNQQLFGFSNPDERHMFRELLKANGVGPKMALAILSGLTVNELVIVIQTGCYDRLTKLPGVGRKTAERLVIELQDKIKKWGMRAVAMPSTNTNMEQLVATNKVSDAVLALESLGYKSLQAQGAIDKIYHEEKSCEDLIKAALQVLA